MKIPCGKCSIHPDGFNWGEYDPMEDSQSRKLGLSNQLAIPNRLAYVPEIRGTMHRDREPSGKR